MKKTFLMTAALALAAVGSASAATITVNSTGDEFTANGQCTLREAIGNANSGNAFPDCANGDDDDGVVDRIVFAPSVTGTILISKHVSYKILTPVSIEGPGAGVLTIDADDFSRIFKIDGGTPGIEVTISGLKLIRGNTGLETDGKDGGAIWVVRSDDQLFLRDSVLSDNQATNGGALQNQGSAEVDRCTFTENESGQFGAAISNLGFLGMLHSAIVHNESVVTGGGVFNFGSLAVFNTTIAANTAALNGGGLSLEGNSNVRLDNVTIALNTADGDGEGNGDGGGIFTGLANAGAQVSLSNSILSGNRDGSAGHEGPDCFGGHLKTIGHNIIGDTKNCFFEGDAGPGDLFDTDPKLGPLADNGGPSLTLLPLAGSPAIDGGNDPAGCFSDDQRGFERPVDADGDGIARCDIGAVEVAAATTPSGGTTGGTTGGDSGVGGDDGGEGTTGGENAAGNSSEEEGAPASGGCSLIR
ncbi:MAG TPA: CSLREA domain-containing protein [bacterium]|nr:CSLREA domain-containing protein [bacterium]